MIFSFSSFNHEENLKKMLARPTEPPGLAWARLGAVPQGHAGTTPSHPRLGTAWMGLTKVRPLRPNVTQFSSLFMTGACWAQMNLGTQAGIQPKLE